MEWWQALILGIVEGITEYLPVSSTGHLLLAERLMGIKHSTEADAFAICIQGGAIVAVLSLYAKRVGSIARGFVGRDPDGFRLGLNIVAAFIPAAIAGLTLDDLITKYLFGGRDWGLWPIVGAWFVGGLAILVAAVYIRRRRESGRARKALEQLTLLAAFLIGMCQIVAMWPGVSRSLVTIVGGVLVGLRLAAAVEFSFLLGVLTLTAATALTALRHWQLMVDSFGISALAVGFVAAYISAILAVKWMVAYLNSHGMEIFGWYRVALALAVAGMIYAGIV